MSNEKIPTNRIDVIIGPQWGDEGKGKIVHKWIEKGSYDLGVRYQGGPNSGHSLLINGKIIALHTLPSSIFFTQSLIGAGVVIDPTGIKKEIEEVVANGGNVLQNLLIDFSAHLIIPTHILLDRAQEFSKSDGKKIGSTHKGMGPVYKDRSGRDGLRIGEIFNNNFKIRFDELFKFHLKQLGLYDGYVYDQSELNKMINDFWDAIEFLKQFKFVYGAYLLNDYIKKDKKILVEGAQASMLDLSFGTYPFVTSSRTLASAVPSELGIPANTLGDVIGVFKAYLTKVGGGTFPTKFEDSISEAIRKEGHEFGASTGRPRDIGWLDIVLMKYAVMINGITHLVITKIDIFDILKEDIKVCVAYKVDGVETDKVEFDLINQFDKVEPVYKTFPSWYGEKVQGCTSFEELPANAKKFLEFIESELGVPICVVSVGPGKDDVFEWNK